MAPLESWQGNSDIQTNERVSVSHTTQAPREKEVNGVHYHFTDRSLMGKDIREGKFLESASVHGNLYGTSIEAVDVVADVGKVKCSYAISP